MDDLTADMTLTEQIGQLVAVGFRGLSPTNDLLGLIRRDRVGGVILFSRNIQSQRQVAALSHSLQIVAREAGHPAPLLVMTDQENGLVRRLGADSARFPGAMALGAMGSPDGERMAEEVARATAQQLLAHGINLNLAPVADVNINPANPVIGVRSFGADVDRVGLLVAATVRGLQESGVIATLKHFPGHGDTTVDSHLALPVVSAARSRLDTVELAPFWRGLAVGAGCVMTAHVAYPALTGGAMTPATLSPEVMTRLLRDDLGFSGVTISDCLEMDAIAKGAGVERGAVEAMRAGVDLILISHSVARQRAALGALRAAVASGTLSAERVRQATQRVLALKRRWLAWHDAPPGPLAAGTLARHHELSAQAYARSVTVARDEGALLPLHLGPDQRILVLDCPPRSRTPAIDVAYRRAWLKETLRRHHPQVRVLSWAASQSPDEVEQAVSAADLVVVCGINAYRDAAFLGAVRRVAELGRPMIGLALGNPYDADHLPEIPTYLATYDYSQPAVIAALSRIFGDEKS